MIIYKSTIPHSTCTVAEKAEKLNCVVFSRGPPIAVQASYIRATMVNVVVAYAGGKVGLSYCDPDTP